MSSTIWTWDPTRSAYYWYNAAENAWVYQDGSRIQVPTQNQDYYPTDPVQPRSYTDEQNTASSAFSQQQSGRERHDSNSTLSATATYGLASSLATMSLVQNNYATTYGSQTEAYQHPYSASTQPCYESSAATAAAVPITQNMMSTDPVQRKPKKKVTENSLYKERGGVAWGKISGTPGDTERLDPRYKLRRPGRKFFVVGKVFKVLWPETAGFTVDNITVVTDPRFGERFVSKIRWFVVVKEGKDCCSCLPIMTYGRQGCAKSGLEKWQHAIAYTDRTEPSPLTGELPRDGEYGMMSPIRVKAKDRQEKLAPQSRINFAKIYTVEHNVKVFEFGDVHEKFLNKLTQQWRYALDRDIYGNKEESNDDDGDSNHLGGEGDANEVGEGSDNDGEDDEDDRGFGGTAQIYASGQNVAYQVYGQGA